MSLGSRQPPNVKTGQKGAWPGSRELTTKFYGVTSRDPKIWALKANSFKTVEGTNFKFGIDAPRESPDMTPEKFLRKGA